MIFPVNASVLSAFGTLVTPVRIDLARVMVRRLDAVDVAERERCSTSCAPKVAECSPPPASAPTAVRFRYGVDARYVGQGNEITIWVGEGTGWPGDDAEVARGVRDRVPPHLRPDDPRRGRRGRHVAARRRPPTPIRSSPTRCSARDRRAAVTDSRQCGSTAAIDAVDTPVYRRERTRRRPPITGPAIVEERETTAVIRPAGTSRSPPTAAGRHPHDPIDERSSTMTSTFDPIELEVLWQSLIATVNEQARALQRAAFSPIVREAGDLANAVFDRRGRMVAQAVTGTPGHINSLARRPPHPRRVPARHAGPGDVLITNDPYKTAGQLLDVTVLCPVFRNGRVIAFFGSTIHHTDVGGYGIGAGGRDVFEEGMWIPICKLMRRRRAQPRRLEVHPLQRPPARPHGRRPPRADGLRRGRRAAAADAVRPARPRRHRGSRRRDHRPLRGGHASGHPRAAGRHVHVRRRARPRRRQPDRHRLRDHGRPRRRRDPRRLRRLVGRQPVRHQRGEELHPRLHHVHRASRAQPRAAEQPRQPGADQGEAPEGSIVNAVSPQPCTARHVVGMFLPNALLKALAQIRPDQAMAEGSGAVWTMQVSGNHDDGRPFITAMFTYAGGVGARATKPGLSACSYPTGVAAVPVEVVEASAPIRFLARSCGRGRRRGRADRRARADDRVHRRHDPAWQLNAVTSRLAEAPQGIFGGEPGASGAFTVNGEPVRTQARSPCSPAMSSASICPAAADTGRPAAPHWRTRRTEHGRRRLDDVLRAVGPGGRATRRHVRSCTSSGPR